LAAEKPQPWRSNASPEKSDQIVFWNLRARQRCL
jgi:hypothetical protein